MRLSTVKISGDMAHELSLLLHLRITTSESPFCTFWKQVFVSWETISLTDSGGHFCWPCDQHLPPLLLAKPREGQEDQLPLPAHACLCWPPRGHCICSSYPQHTEWGETAYFHHHTVYCHGDCVVLWRVHYSCIAVPQDTVSVQYYQGFCQRIKMLLPEFHTFFLWQPRFFRTPTNVSQRLFVVSLVLTT